MQPYLEFLPSYTNETPP